MRDSITRWFCRASKPAAPDSGTRSVMQVRTGACVASSWSTTASMASLAITRQVVSLPPATSTRPGAGALTVCSREIREVGSVSPDSSGRSPAYTPSTSSWSSGSRSTSLTCASR